MDEPSQDYHDYVFKNGKLLGDFEEMYRHSADIPWHQDRSAYDLCSDIDLAILRQHCYRSICDVGCGLGYFTSRLFRELVTPEGTHPKVVGLDISETAVRKGQNLFTDVQFFKVDLLKENIPPHLGTFDLVVAKELIWYVCQDLEMFIINICQLGGRGTNSPGYVFISQQFPLCDQWVGQEFISSVDKLVQLLRRFLEIQFWCVEYGSKAYRELVHILAKVT
jgi:SAM-dependent methyltransferase